MYSVIILSQLFFSLHVSRKKYIIILYNTILCQKTHVKIIVDAADTVIVPEIKMTDADVLDMRKNRVIVNQK